MERNHDTPTPLNLTDFATRDCVSLAIAQHERGCLDSADGPVARLRLQMVDIEKTMARWGAVIAFCLVLLTAVVALAPVLIQSRIPSAHAQNTEIKK